MEKRFFESLGVFALFFFASCVMIFLFSFSIIGFTMYTTSESSTAFDVTGDENDDGDENDFEEQINDMDEVAQEVNEIESEDPSSDENKNSQGIFYGFSFSEIFNQGILVNVIIGFIVFFILLIFVLVFIILIRFFSKRPDDKLDDGKDLFNENNNISNSNSLDLTNNNEKPKESSNKVENQIQNNNLVSDLNLKNNVPQIQKKQESENAGQRIKQNLDAAGEIKKQGDNNLTKQSVEGLNREKMPAGNQDVKNSVNKAEEIKELSNNLRYIRYYSNSISKDIRTRIRYLISVGKIFVENKDFFSAKWIYSFINEEYKTLKVHDEALYREILDFRKSFIG